MPKLIGSGGATIKRSIVLEADIYDRLMQHLGDSPGAFSDYIRRMMRHSVRQLDARARSSLPETTQKFLDQLLPDENLP